MLRLQELVILLRLDKRLPADESLRRRGDKKIITTDRGGTLSRRNHILQEVRLAIHGIIIHGIIIIPMAPGATMDQAGILTLLTRRQIVEAAVVQCVRVRHPVQERVVGRGAETN